MKKDNPKMIIIRILSLVVFVFMAALSGALNGQVDKKSPVKKEIVEIQHRMKQEFLSAKRIVFLGDSNTHAGEYVNQIEARLLKRFGKAPEIINLGLPSETCSGLSEPAHPFPRPDVHERLTRAIKKTKPDFVVACYGMNDGIYHPYDDERFKTFQVGIQKLIVAHSTAKIPLLLLTPPPFDPLPMKKSGALVSADSKEFLWSKIYENYDEEVIEKYAQWMLSLNGPDNLDCLVVDVHTPINDYLNERRKSDSEFAFSKDGVHFDNVGHRVFADAFFNGLAFDGMAEPSDALLKLVRQRQRISHAAWLTEVEHKRPGMKDGLSMPEAFLEMKPIDEKIKSCLGSSKGFQIPEAAIEKILELKKKHKAATIGIGIIKNGELVWTGYYGDQSPGVPAGRSTMFNTASVNKAVTTETFLRLAEKGLLGLEEPVAPFYVHPDLVDDARYAKLTPRIILTHRTGFRNWPHEYDDGKLAFDHEPGKVYGYSGAGFMILANYIQKKIGKPFPEIVREEVFEPIGMKHSSIIQEKWMDGKVLHTLLEDGSFDPDFELDLGYWNSADELFVSVEDYAKFLISVMNGEGVGDKLGAERIRVQSDLTNNEIWGFEEGDVVPAPSPFGHGLGWFLFGYDGNLNVQHGGNDMSEAAIGYFETGTKNGLVVFVNAPNPQGILLWPQIVDVLDEDAKFTAVFHNLIEKYFAESDADSN